MTENERRADHPGQGPNVSFMIHDEDDGSSAPFEARRGGRLREAVTAGYDALRREPRVGDRLRGENGTPISPEAEETVAAYLAHGGSTVWLLAGPTGGAKR